VPPYEVEFGPSQAQFSLAGQALSRIYSTCRPISREWLGLTLLSIVEHTIGVTVQASELLDLVVAGELIDATSLPKATDAERKAPQAS
jgi:hypothetical protein